MLDIDAFKEWLELELKACEKDLEFSDYDSSISEVRADVYKKVLRQLGVMLPAKFGELEEGEFFCFRDSSDVWMKFRHGQPYHLHAVRITDLEECDRSTEVKDHCPVIRMSGTFYRKD